MKLTVAFDKAIFDVAQIGKEVAYGYNPIARQLGDEQPVAALREFDLILTKAWYVRKAAYPANETKNNKTI